jgi:hypothetical protein
MILVVVFRTTELKNAGKGRHRINRRSNGIGNKILTKIDQLPISKESDKYKEYGTCNYGI